MENPESLISDSFQSRFDTGSDIMYLCPSPEAPPPDPFLPGFPSTEEAPANHRFPPLVWVEPDQLTCDVTITDQSCDSSATAESKMLFPVP